MSSSHFQSRCARTLAALVHARMQTQLRAHTQHNSNVQLKRVAKDSMGQEVGPDPSRPAHRPVRSHLARTRTTHTYTHTHTCTHEHTHTHNASPSSAQPRGKFNMRQALELTPRVSHTSCALELLVHATHTHTHTQYARTHLCINIYLDRYTLTTHHNVQLSREAKDNMADAGAHPSRLAHHPLRSHLSHTQYRHTETHPHKHNVH